MRSLTWIHFKDWHNGSKSRDMSFIQRELDVRRTEHFPDTLSFNGTLFKRGARGHLGTQTLKQQRWIIAKTPFQKVAIGWNLPFDSVQSFMFFFFLSLLFFYCVIFVILTFCNITCHFSSLFLIEINKEKTTLYTYVVKFGL